MRGRREDFIKINIINKTIHNEWGARWGLFRIFWYKREDLKYVQRLRFVQHQPRTKSQHLTMLNVGGQRNWSDGWTMDAADAGRDEVLSFSPRHSRQKGHWGCRPCWSSSAARSPRSPPGSWCRSPLATCGWSIVRMAASDWLRQHICPEHCFSFKLESRVRINEIQMHSSDHSILGSELLQITVRFRIYSQKCWNSLFLTLDTDLKLKLCSGHMWQATHLSLSPLPEEPEDPLGVRE